MSAVNAGLAGSPGGDFDDEAFEQLERALEWLWYVGAKRGYC